MVSFPPASDRDENDLAPVTYLPGVQPPAKSNAPDAAEQAAPDVAAQAAPDAVRPHPDEFDNPSPEERAHETATAATRALSRRGMSRWELETFLVQRDFEAPDIEAELDRLERSGLLDDAALAETLVRTQHERKGLGRTAVTRELSRRRIDPRVIAEAVSGIDDDDELQRATEVATKRAGQLSGLDAATAERRLNAYMMRRGYSSQIVREVTRAALADRPKRGSVRFR